MPHALPGRVTVREVGMRDGLHSIGTILPSERKIERVRKAFAAGQREIEVGSFVAPKLMTHLADTAKVPAFAKILPGLRASALVPNLKGAKRALGLDADFLILPVSPSKPHSMANLRKTTDDVIAVGQHPRRARRIRAAAAIT